MRSLILFVLLTSGLAAELPAKVTSPAPGWYYEQSSSTVKSGDYFGATVHCPVGSSIISGGFALSGTPDGIWIQSNDPVFGPKGSPQPQQDGWHVNILNKSGSGRAIVLDVLAHCGDLPPPPPPPA